MRGTELLAELARATGLPDDLIGHELSRIVASTGKTTDEVTIDELRELLASYLQDVLMDAKGAFANEETARAEMERAAEALGESIKDE